MRALVTGASGFIGAWIIKALSSDGYDIRAFDLRPQPTLTTNIVGPAAEKIDWRTGDVADGAALLAAADGCDLIVHLAAILTPDCQRDPLRGANVNLIGTLNAFEAARHLGHTKVLYMSSAGVFGPDHATEPQPTTLYGAYKLAGEGIARAYWTDHAITSVGFRPLIVYGPERQTGLTAAPSLACRAAARGESAEIPFTGLTDFVYVTDVAAAFAAAAGAEIDGARVYNVTGETMSAAAFAAAVEQQVPGVRITTSGPTLPVAAGMDGAALRRDFPALPLTSVATGIARTIAFYRERAA